MNSGDDENQNGFAANLIDIILHSKIFSSIDRSACEALLPRLERITLPQGDILFEQGDPSDCLYILVEGQLIAIIHTHEGKNKIVGTIEKGETVGELGALSNQPRSLTIRASTNSKLLKLSHKQFEVFCKEQPQFISRIIDLIITRSQNTLKLLSQKKIYKHIAIIGGNQEAPLKHFLDKFKEVISHDPTFIFLEDDLSQTQLNQLTEEAEQKNQIIIFALNENNFNSYRTKLKHINSIFVVVDGDVPTFLSDLASTMLSRHKTPFATRYELVLVHDDETPLPTGTKDWLMQAKFTMHHHIKINNIPDYQRFLRFIQGKAIGLVFGGGGQKGWVHIGVLKALLDANIPIDAIGGTSVGAVAAASYAKTLNYAKAYKIFENNSYASKDFFGLSNLTLPLISIITSKRQTEALMADFKFNAEDLWLPFFSITSNLTTGKEVVNREGMLWENLRAGAALPGIAPPSIIDGEICYDGGLLNNLPVDHMQTILNNEGITIAVSLSNQPIRHVNYNFPPVITFWIALIKLLKLGYKNYKFPPYMNTFLNSLLIGGATKEKTNELAADILINPHLNQFRLLKINKKIIHEMIEIGYKHTYTQLQSTHILKT
ncbi:MAG: patatin-like phospholipase family protein [Gammaproteobacteria bacterium]